ncbi:MAG: hypothetical protein FWD47_03590 [Treponema sp.]|nr:hypothetical protein [Treponema sp.]
MKNLHVLFCILIMMMFIGCGSSPSSTPDSGSRASASGTQVNNPQWLDETPPRDAFHGVGYIRLQDEGAALRAATRLARQDVAEQLSQLVQGMMTNYYREAGTLNNPTAIRHIEEVSRIVWNVDLSNAFVINRTPMPNNTWWVRVSLLKSDARNTIVEIFDNEADRYSTWLRDEAVRMLDNELNRSQSRPTPRTE